MWIVEGEMDREDDNEDDNEDEDDGDDDDKDNEDDNGNIKEDINDYKPWLKNDVALRFICDLISIQSSPLSRIVCAFLGYYCLFDALLLSPVLCDLQLALSSSFTPMTTLDCYTLSTNVVLVDSIIKWPMTQSHIEYGMQKAYDEDDKDEITNEKPKINKK